MKLLALETSGSACSVALAIDGAVSERECILPRRHGEVLLSWIDELLAAGGVGGTMLDAIAVSRGPGSFTSLRLGASVALGLALGWEVPLIPVSSLAALAAGAAEKHGVRRIAAAFDARRGQYYFVCFAANGGRLQPCGAEQLAGAAEIVPAGPAWFGAGPGYAARDGELAAALAPHLAGVDADCRPRAAAVAALALDARPLDPDDFTLHYGRDNVVQPAL